MVHRDRQQRRRQHPDSGASADGVFDDVLLEVDATGP
jgi:hypothetical protein